MKSLNQRFQQKRNDYLDTGKKSKISITKISYLGQTVRNFITGLGRQADGSVKNAPDKKEVENFWREIYGNKVKHNGEACWIKNTGNSKIQAWN